MSCSWSRGRIPLVRVQGLEGRLLVGAGTRQSPASGSRGAIAPRLVPRAMRLGQGFQGQERPGWVSRATPWMVSRGKASVMGRREHEGSPDGSMGCQSPGLEGCNGRAKRHPCQASAVRRGVRTVSPHMACTSSQAAFYQDSMKRRDVGGGASSQGLPAGFGTERGMTWPSNRPSRSIPQTGTLPRRNHRRAPFRSASFASPRSCARRLEPPTSGCTFCMRRL